ncbi:MAG: protein kinase [Planctomycetes bacterium]|nr:protein kinase [Planctomycetota bacterium]
MSEPTVELPPPDPKGSKNTKGSGPENPSEPNQTLIMPAGSTTGTGGLGTSGGAGQDEAALAEWFKTFYNYEVVKKLGEGGMGSVYKARQKNLNRTVALKVLPQRLSADKRYNARLLREAQVLAKINHTNMIACYDVGEHQGLLFVVMEFVEGESLYELIGKRGRLPLAEALSYLKQAVLGLDHANAVGVIHRDIKPENILLSTVRPQGTTIRANPFNSLKIADLGLAAYTDDSQQNTRLTVEGSALGSPYYMSPEQTLGEKNLDLRTDIYALGITLYQMVTGKMPYEAQTIAAILAKKLSETIPDPRALNPELPAGLSLLLQRMTARKKEDRYASYGELLKDIEAIEQQRPLSSPVLPPERGSVTLLPDTLQKLGAAGRGAVGPDEKARGGIGAQPPSSRLSMAMIAGMGAGVLVLLGVLFVLLGAPSSSATSKPPAPVPVQVAPPQGVPPPQNPPSVAPPQVRPPPVAYFEPKSLIDNKTTQGWTDTGEKHVFTFETEQDALTLQAQSKDFAFAEREVPAAEYKLTGTLKIETGADECEIQAGLSSETYAAIGIRFPLNAKKASAYLELRDTKTNKVLKVENKKDGLDPDAWHDVRIQCWDGQAVCFIGPEPFGSVDVSSLGTKKAAIRIAVHNGIGLFRNLQVLPRPAEKP